MAGGGAFTSLDTLNGTPEDPRLRKEHDTLDSSILTREETTVEPSDDARWIRLGLQLRRRPPGGPADPCAKPRFPTQTAP